ncbi:MAG: GNAT family N-acetyltransferase [Asticcacaulis sp.]
MPYTPQIRQIKLAELEIVRDLALQIWPKCYRSIIAPDQIDQMLSTLFDLDTLEADITRRGHVYWVIRVGHLDVGFASAHMDGSRVWLTKLYVLADYRGFGLGKALIRAAQRHFSPAAHMSVCVHKEHDAAVDFCLRSGFSIDREIPFSLGAYGFTDYVMRKDLGN